MSWVLGIYGVVDELDGSAVPLFSMSTMASDLHAIKLPQAPIELMLRSGIDYRPGMARYYAEQYLSPAYASSRAQIRRQTATA